MPIVSQNVEVDAVLEAAKKLAKRTQTHFVVDPKRRENFVTFGEAVAAYSCADALGVWGDPSSLGRHTTCDDPFDDCAIST